MNGHGRGPCEQELNSLAPDPRDLASHAEGEERRQRESGDKEGRARGGPPGGGGVTALPLFPQCSRQLFWW